MMNDGTEPAPRSALAGALGADASAEVRRAALGALLGAAFLGMIPAGLEQAPAREVLAAVLAGIVLVLGSIIAIRVWWFSRQLRKQAGEQTAPQDPAAGGVIEGEYHVVKGDKNS